jgi:hypothetical protein
MARNDITLDSIRTHAPSEKYDEGYERIFGKKKVVQEEAVQETAEQKEVEQK